MGSSRLNKNGGFFESFAWCIFSAKNDWNTKQIYKNTCQNVQWLLNKFLLLPNATCYWWNDLHHTHVWLRGCVERLKCSSIWDAKNGFRNIQATHEVAMHDICLYFPEPNLFHKVLEMIWRWCQLNYMVKLPLTLSFLVLWLAWICHVLDSL